MRHETREGRAVPSHCHRRSKLAEGDPPALCFLTCGNSRTLEVQVQGQGSLKLWLARNRGQAKTPLLTDNRHGKVSQKPSTTARQRGHAHTLGVRQATACGTALPANTTRNAAERPACVPDSAARPPDRHHARGGKVTEVAPQRLQSLPLLRRQLTKQSERRPRPTKDLRRDDSACEGEASPEECGAEQKKGGTGASQPTTRALELGTREPDDDGKDGGIGHSG